MRKAAKWVAITLGVLLLLGHGGCTVALTLERPQIYAGTKAYLELIEKGGMRYFSGDPSGTAFWWLGLPFAACVDTILLVYTVPHALFTDAHDSN